MRTVMTSLAVLALVACNKPAETTTDLNAVGTNMTVDENAAMDANWRLCRVPDQRNDLGVHREGKATTESWTPAAITSPGQATSISTMEQRS
jgi:hypothetical protein